MAKVPPPKGKGEPPSTEDIVGNLDKPETDELVPLNFKVSRGFKRDFKLFAAHNDMFQIEVLQKAFAALKNESTK